MANVTYGGPVRSKAGFGQMILGNEVFVSKVQHTKITTTQVLALNATPVEILPAVGTTNYMRFLGAYMFQDYAGTAYVDDADEDPVIQIAAGGADVSLDMEGGNVDDANDFLVWFSPLVPGASSIQEALVELTTNTSLEMTINTGELVTGNSDWDVLVYYDLLSVAGLEGLS